MSFYAVVQGRTTGIFLNWSDCKNSVVGYKGALYKKFSTIEEAELYINKNKIVFIPDYYVYTDGASSNNGYVTAKAGIGVFFGENDSRNISEYIGNNTNQVAELTAILRVLQIINKLKLTDNIMIVSDSEYAIRCITGYYEASHNNLKLVIEAKSLRNNNIQFMHVKAHTGKQDIHSIGNFHADKLATNALMATNALIIDK